MRSGSRAPYNASDACSADDGESLFFIGSVCGATPADTPAAPVIRAGRAVPAHTIHPGPARLLSLSPDGSRLAFASPGSSGRDRLMLIDPAGTVLADLPSDGRIEQIGWAPDSRAILLLVAGEGTDTTTIGGSVGGGGSEHGDSAPTLADGTPDPEDWRRLAIHLLGNGQLVPGPAVDGMIWEASWCGTGAIAILHSATAGEAAWYEARLALVDVATGALRPLHCPAEQIGHLAGSPDGQRLAFVEGVASDRGLVCGPLKLIECDTDRVSTVDTGAVEITSVAWRTPSGLLLAGQAGLNTVIANHDLGASGFHAIWSSVEWSCGSYLATARPTGAEGAIGVFESFSEPPRIAMATGGEIEILCGPFGVPDAHAGDAQPLRWAAPDGTEIEGILIRPHGAIGPLPLVVDIHGGPIWAYRAAWHGRQRATPALIAAGISVLCPNPRGSFGRGQPFAAAVLGDMGGADALDLLAGVDHLVEQGLVDPDRVGLTGSSYGGYMSALLPKLRQRIAAAVSISPVSNWFSQHWTSNMPILETLFIGGEPGEMGDEYARRSPALSPAPTQAATLILAGALDRCTPIGQSIELHRSLLAQGSTSVLVTYPRDGHGVRSPGGIIDSAARSLDWFTRYLLA